MKTLFAILALLLTVSAFAQAPTSPEQRALGQQVMAQLNELIALRTQLLTAQDEVTACKAATKVPPAEAPH